MICEKRKRSDISASIRWVEVTFGRSDPQFETEGTMGVHLDTYVFGEGYFYAV